MRSILSVLLFVVLLPIAQAMPCCNPFLEPGWFEFSSDQYEQLGLPAETARWVRLARMGDAEATQKALGLGHDQLAQALNYLALNEVTASQFGDTLGLLHTASSELLWQSFIHQIGILYLASGSVQLGEGKFPRYRSGQLVIGLPKPMYP